MYDNVRYMTAPCNRTLSYINCKNNKPKSVADHNQFGTK